VVLADRHLERVPVGRLVGPLAAFGAALALLCAPAAAGAADFTWTGAAAVNPEEGQWSNAANWGGTAPAGSVGRLTFPALPEPPCSSQPGQFVTCYLTKNDISGLEIEAISIDDGVNYLLSGNPITLGRGGLTAAPSAADPQIVLVPQVELPIVLSAPQTWTIAGGPNNQQLGLDANVTGQSEDLGIQLSAFGFLSVRGDVEVGRVSVTGQGGLALGPTPNDGSLNGADKNPVEFGGGSALVAYGPHSTIGPLTMSSGTLQVGSGIPEGTLSVSGPLGLDSRVNLNLYISHGGTTPGTESSQLRVAGKANLNGAHLILGGVGSGNGQRSCAGLRVGTEYRLIEASGGLAGRFAGIADGATIPLELCGTAVAPMVRIDYSRHAVVATIEAAGPPVLGKRETVKVLSGLVTVRPRGGRRFVSLAGAASLPIGSEVDATPGRVLVTAAEPGPHRTASAELHGGRFRIEQTRAHRGETHFALSQPLSGCHGARSPRSKTAGLDARHSGSHSRHLWTSDHGGRWGTNGKYVSTTVEGTRWLTLDTCTSSKVKVAAGRVRVHDLITNGTRTLTAGQSYVAHR
jgi:hypothetical protein